MADGLEYANYLISNGYPVNKVLSFIKIHKTTWYRYKNKLIDRRIYNKGRPIPGFSYTTSGDKICDAEIIQKILQLRNETHTLTSGGYKKIKHYLRRRFSIVISYKKTYRLCKENKVCLSKKYNKKPIRHLSINRKVTRPHQVWEFDIKYSYIHAENRFFYILVYIDVFSRMIVGFYVGLQCKSVNLAATFSSALRKNNIDPNTELVIRSDNGSQMTSKQFYRYLSQEITHRVQHEFIPCATPNKNAHVESFYSIVEAEFIYPNYFLDIRDVYNKFCDFVGFYNTVRVHGSLKYYTPSEIIELYDTGQSLPPMKPINI